MTIYYTLKNACLMVPREYKIYNSYTYYKKTNVAFWALHYNSNSYVGYNDLMFSHIFIYIITILFDNALKRGF